MNLNDSKIRLFLIYRQTIKGLVLKNLKDKYVGSYLGIWWAILNPVLLSLVIVFIFTQIMKSEVEYFTLFILSAILPFFFFINSLTESTSAIKNNINILNQFTIPSEIIPVSVVLANFINFLLGFIFLLPIFIFFQPQTIPYLPLLLFVIFLHFIFTLGISLLFSILSIYFKDLPQLLNILAMFLFWATPIFYSLEMIPPAFHWITIVNPAACYVLIYRAVLYYSSPGAAWMWLLAVGFAAISIVFGHVFFLKKEDVILKRI